jgi:hypothetical protein
MSKKGLLWTAIILTMATGCASSSATEPSSDKGFGRSKDRAEIEQLVKDYARGVDFKDTARWMSIWSTDAVYDLSNLGFGMVQGREGLENFMNCVVFPGEPMCFSLISNIDITFTGGNTAVGTDYFIHEGYVPVPVGSGQKFSQFFPSTWYLLENLLDVGSGALPVSEFAFVRDHKEGQHQYEFVIEKGKWKISYMKGLPLFSSTEAVLPLPGKDTLPIDQRPDTEFFEYWLSHACTECQLFGPCP